MLTGDLASRTYAPGAQVDTNGQPVNFKRGGLYVREPGPHSMSLGVAYPVAEM